jgi:hypothetical protein
MIRKYNVSKTNEKERRRRRRVKRKQKDVSALN